MSDEHTVVIDKIVLSDIGLEFEVVTGDLGWRLGTFRRCFTKN